MRPRVMSTPAALPVIAAPPARMREELRALLALAGPLVGANLLQMAVYSSDAIFVARLGPAALAAATLGVYTYSVIMTALIGLVSACAPLVAAELGRHAHAVRQVRRSLRMALWLAVLASLPFMALMAKGEWLLRLLGQDAAVAQSSGQFLRILLWALIPTVAAGAIRIVVAALGRPGWASAITALALPLNLLGNWLLVFGHGGLPALGIRGSALASVTTSMAMLLAYLAVLRFDPKLRRWHLLGHWWRPELPRLREIARLGLPIAVTVTFEGGLFAGAALLMGLIGVTEVAAHAIALQIAAVAFQVPLGIAQAATVRVGMAFGAQDEAWIGRAGWVALVLGTATMALTATLIWIDPRLLIAAFVDPSAPANARLVRLAIAYLGIAAMFQLVDGAQVVAQGVLRGLQDTRMPMLIAGLGYWIGGFGTAILLGLSLGWGGVGIWLGLATGLAIVAVLLVARWARRKRLGLLDSGRGGSHMPAGTHCS